MIQNIEVDFYTFDRLLIGEQNHLILYKDRMPERFRKRDWLRVSTAGYPEKIDLLVLGVERFDDRERGKMYVVSFENLTLGNEKVRLQEKVNELMDSLNREVAARRAAEAEIREITEREDYPF